MAKVNDKRTKPRKKDQESPHCEETSTSRVVAERATSSSPDDADIAENASQSKLDRKKKQKPSKVGKKSATIVHESGIRHDDAKNVLPSPMIESATTSANRSKKDRKKQKQSKGDKKSTITDSNVRSPDDSSIPAMKSANDDGFILKGEKQMASSYNKESTFNNSVRSPDNGSVASVISSTSASRSILERETNAQQKPRQEVGSWSQ